jgi:nitrite reductase (NADH) small subunit
MTAAMTDLLADVWTAVCRSADLVPDRGVCALVGDRHVAVFRLSGTDELCAVDNVDPFTGASVLSRGLVGSAEIEGEFVAYVASPLRKQRFDLRSGRCLDDDEVRLDVFDATVDGGVVIVRPTANSGNAGSSWSNVRETGA